MAAFTPSASHFFFFVWTLISLELAMNALFRFVAYAVRSLAAANAILNAGVGVLLMFGASQPREDLRSRIYAA